MAKRSGGISFSKLIPEDSFIGCYLRYMLPTETATAYDFFTALFVLGNVIGRGTVVNRPRAPVFLNLYIILVAESGITRKSTAVREATKVLRNLDINGQLIEGKITPEKLEYDLSEQSKLYGSCSAAITISELVTFLGREKYTEAMPTLLTDLYDCAAFRGGGGAIKSGARNQHNIFVSFLSASTPAWLLRAVNPDIIEGGFTSRVLFVVADRPKHFQAWPEKQDDTLREDILDKLRTIKTLAKSRPTIEISPGGKTAFGRWYKSRPLARDVFRSSFQSREDAHVLRLAALLSINDGSWVIMQSHVLAAIKLVVQVREDGAAIFAGSGNNSKIIAGLDRVRDKLLGAGVGGLPQRELTRACQGQMNSETLLIALDIMHDLAMVTKFENIQVGRGRPVTIWRGTPALAQSKAIETIVKGLAE